MKQNHGPAPPLRVCHVFCGTEGATWMLEQLRELRRRFGYDVHAVVSGSQGSLIDKLKAENIPFHVSPFVFSITHPFAIIRAVFLMQRLFGRERFDVVQSHVFWSAFLARPAAWLANVPVRLAMIAGPYHLQAFSSRWVDRSTAWMETTLIPSCRKSVDLYRAMGVPAERLALIYYGSDTGTFDPAQTSPAGIRAEYGWSDKTPVVALIAYFYAPQPWSTWTPPGLHCRGVKGHDLFIKATPLVAEEFPDAKFLVVGSDWSAQDYKLQLEHMVRHLGLEDRVVFTGYRPDVNRILQDVDVAVQASRSENLGGTIEALLMECPVVATRVGGMPDTVRDRETGILVNPSDPADLARGILEMLRNPEQARAWGRNGRRLMIREFSLDKTVADLHALYTRLLAANPRRPRFLFWCVSVCRSVMAPFAAFYCAYGLAVIRLAATRKRKAVIKRMTVPAPVQAPEQTSPARPPLYVHRTTLIHCNLPGDIVPPENVTQLHLGGDLPRNGLYLALGWHGLEQDEQGSFRWLRSGGEVVVTRPDSQEKRLVLDVQSGPGRLCLPFQLRLVNERGTVVGRATVPRHRGEIAFQVRPGVDGVKFRLKAPAGIPIPSDVRILNVRVRRISWQSLPQDVDALKRHNLPKDIVPGASLQSLYSGALPQSGILLGRGWHALYSDDCGPFRWMHTAAEVLITGPVDSCKRILIDVEPGSTEDSRWRELGLSDDRGALLDRATICTRQQVVFRVPVDQPGAILRLVALEEGSKIWNRIRAVFRILAWLAAGGRAGKTDASAPKFRVRRISWAEDSDNVASVEPDSGVLDAEQSTMS